VETDVKGLLCGVIGGHFPVKFKESLRVFTKPNIRLEQWVAETHNGKRTRMSLKMIIGLLNQSKFLN